MTTATAQQQQQHPLQTAMKKTKIPHQFIPLICVLVIAKIPTCLLAGFVLGYFILFRQQDDSPRETRLIEAPPANPPFVAQNSLEYDNEPHYASINHPTLDDQQEQDDISNASSIDFENLMKFPSCPTTLPRLDTHFNFVSDDENHHHLQESSTIDWSAIHQELEYDKQRNSKAKIKKEQHSLATSQSQNDMLTFSSSSSTSEEDEEVSSLLSLETTTKPSSAKQKTNPVMTPLPHDNNAAAAILLVDQPDHSERAMSPLAPPTATTTIDNMTLLDDILLLPPSPMLLPRPSLSSPGQLFKSKFQRAVSRMKKSNSNSGQGSLASRRSSTQSQDSYITSSMASKASSLQLQSFFPNPSSPRPSASTRLNDQFKSRLNKLLKK